MAEWLEKVVRQGKISTCRCKIPIAPTSNTIAHKATV